MKKTNDPIPASFALYTEAGRRKALDTILSGANCDTIFHIVGGCKPQQMDRSTHL